LGKLREALRDPLFTRGPQGMVPTLHGELTYKKFSAAMAQIESAIEPVNSFDAATSTKRFSIAMSDIGELIFLPPILRQLQREAPDVEIEVVQVAMSEVAGWLAAGKVDAAIGHLPNLVEAARNVPLFSEHYVCLARQDRSSIGAPLDMERFLAARHIFVSSPFSGHRIIADMLNQSGVSRKVTLQIPHFTIVPQLLLDNDLLVTLPSQVGAYFCMHYRLRMLALPIEIPSFKVRMFWHEHQEEKASHRWLRDLIYKTLHDYAGPSSPRVQAA
jgi:DNA-binding transcriptional LysR family regulator